MSPSSPPSSPTLGVLILNWNGAPFIERCLASVLAAERRLGIELECVVYDDASTDGSPDLIARGFAGFRLIRGEKNIGFARAAEAGLNAMRADAVFLLNNDLVLKTDFFERLLAAWRESVAGIPFAVGAQTRQWDTQTINHGGQRARWSNGLIVQEAFEAETAMPADFFQAGACLLDRRRLFEMGGFAPIFHPGYWEDYDLAFQARARGWSILYEPRAVAYHWGKGSMRRLLGDWGLALMIKRNHLLFVWANLDDAGLWLRHALNLPGLVLTERNGMNEPGWGRALLAALPRLGAVLRLRRGRGTGWRGKTRKIMENVTFHMPERC